MSDKITTTKLGVPYNERLKALAKRDRRSKRGELEFLIESAEKWNPAPTPEQLEKNRHYYDAVDYNKLRREEGRG